MRAIRIELRRSSALWAGLVIALVGLGMFYGLPGPWSKGTDAWTQEWSSLAMWQRWMLNLMWPVALGAGAWQGRRDRRSTMDELLSSTPKPPFLRVVPPVLALCIGATAAYLTIFLVGAIQVMGNAGYHHVGWLPVTIVGILSMIAAVLAGMGIGRVFPFLLTAPILAVLGLVAMEIALLGGPGTESTLDSTVSLQVALLSPVFDYSEELFAAVSAQVDLVQGLWFLSLAVTGFGLLTLVRRKALALIPAIAGVSIALLFLPSSKADLFTPDASASELVCADGAPRVCVSRLHQDHLAEVVGPARQALTQLAKLPDAPTSVVEARSPLREQNRLPKPADVAYFHFDDWDFRKNSRRTILAGPEMLRCDTDMDKLATSTAQRMVVASWFDGELRPVASSTLMTPELTAMAQGIWQEVRSLPADQQPAKIAQLREDAGQC